MAAAQCDKTRTSHTTHLGSVNTKPRRGRRSRSRCWLTRSARSSSSRSVCPRRTSRKDPAARSSGAQLFAADFTIKNVFTNAGTNGDYEWSGIFTPYTPGTATPNPGRHARGSHARGPALLADAQARRGEAGFKLTGQLKIAGVDPKGVRLDLYARQKAAPAPNAVSARDRQARRRVQRQAALERQVTLARPSVKFATFFQIQVRELHDGVCTGPSPSGLPVPVTTSASPR